MGRPAVFFDRDNTLIVNDGYLGDPAGVVLMPGAAAAVAAVRAVGFAVVVVSNQSGVARGLFDEAAVRAVDRRTADLLAAADAGRRVDLHLYCPFHPHGPGGGLPAGQPAGGSRDRDAAGGGRAAVAGPAAELARGRRPAGRGGRPGGGVPDGAVHAAGRGRLAGGRGGGGAADATVTRLADAVAFIRRHP